jgi:phospholipase/carboxylesterase
VTDPDEAALDATADLVGRLFPTLDHLEAIARRLHPPTLVALVSPLEPEQSALRLSLDAFSSVAWPEHLIRFRDQCALATEAALRACDGLLAAAAGPDGLRPAYRALRQLARATEALYPLTEALPSVSRWFLEPSSRDDPALLGRLATPPPDIQTGVLHVGNETTERGGFSVYVPETYDAGRACPVIVALHGGAGHGRLFLWSWVREARSRGAILVAPTARGDTWSLMEPEIDGSHLAKILALVGERWHVDPRRRLLTGMSDGGTFTLLSGLHEESPFTHLAPAAASFHPLLLTMTEPARVRGLPIYLVHGALDWMFPVSVARTAHRALTAAGARVTYRELPDLSHAYPRDENSRILDWLLES